MVRIKYRYLLVHILYPDQAESDSKPTTRPSEKSIPDLVQFHRPSPNDLQPQHLVRAIKDQVLLLYGDYGLGLISVSLNGYTIYFLFNVSLTDDKQSSTSQPQPQQQSFDVHAHIFDSSGQLWLS